MKTRFAVSNPGPVTRAVRRGCSPPAYRLLMIGLGLASPDFDPEAVIRVHVDVRHPGEREEGHQRPAPVRVINSESGHEQQTRRHPVREAVFAREEIKKLPLDEPAAVAAAVRAVGVDLAERLLVRNRPGDAGDRDRVQE